MNTLAAATTYEVAIKAVEPLRIASIRGVVPSVEQLGDTFDSLFAVLDDFVGANGGPAGPPMAIYHDSGSGPQMLNMRVELAIPFEGDATGINPVHVYELPPVDRVAYVIHKGPFEAISSAYGALQAWVRDKGYRLSGPTREIYLSCGEGDSSGYITEVQFPLAG